MEEVFISIIFGGCFVAIMLINHRLNVNIKLFKTYHEQFKNYEKQFKDHEELFKDYKEQIENCKKGIKISEDLAEAEKERADTYQEINKNYIKEKMAPLLDKPAFRHMPGAIVPQRDMNFNKEDKDE